MEAIPHHPRSFPFLHALPNQALRRCATLGRAPADGASVAAFRIIFGLIALASILRFFANGWIAPLYIEPDYHFTYLGFAWVRPWPGWGMYAHFAVLALLSLGIIVGRRWRICVALFCLGFTYVELIDRTTYLNHYYLMSLVSLLLALLPFRGNTVPLWTLWVLRAQLGAVYLFAGIAKLNSDWLLHALPLRIWLYQHGDAPLFGPLLQEVWTAYAMSWGSALFDMAIVPALFWRRTRFPAYALLVVFHLATSALFPQLGIFPWLMIGLTTIFFPPDWPRRVLSWLSIPSFLRRPELRTFPLRNAPDAGRTQQNQPAGRRDATGQSWRTHAAIVAFLMFAAVQLAMPLRHYAYPGNVRWNEQGYRFAWRVMLSEKVGFVQYRVRHTDSGQSWLAFPDDYLTPLQAERMAIQPDMILQTAHIIAADFAARGYPNVVVTADAFVSFNGRANAKLIDPNADLAAIKPGLAPKEWVLP